MVLRPQALFRVHLSTPFKVVSISLPTRAIHHTNGNSNDPLFRVPKLQRCSIATSTKPHPKLLHARRPPEPSRPPKVDENRSEDVLEAPESHSDASSSVYEEDGQHGDLESVNMDEYLQRRRGHPAYLKRLSPFFFSRLGRLAMKQKLHGVINTVASDVVSMARIHAEDLTRHSTQRIPIQPKDYDRTAATLLHIAYKPYALNDNNVIDLTKIALGRSAAVNPPNSTSEDHPAIQSSPTFSLDVLSRVLQAISHRPSSWPMEKQKRFLQALVKAVDERIDSEINGGQIGSNIVGFPLTPPRKIDAEGLSRLTRVLFKFIQSILERDDDSLWDLAYEAFEVIVKHNLIPPEAIRREDKDLAHVPTIIMSPIIHTCLVHGWTLDAADLLQSLQLSNAKLKPHYEALVEDVVYSLLDLKAANGVRRAAELIKSAFERVPEFEFNEECMQKVYEAACSCGLRNVGTDLYFHLRSRYPSQSANLLPKGTTLVLLMDTFAKRSTNKDGLKLLARHVLERRPRISKHASPTIIALCAESLLFEESRQLYEYYAHGTDKVMVTGNPRVMVGLVKLFAGGEQRKDIQRGRFAGKSTDVGSGFRPEGFQDADSAAEFASNGGEQSRKESEARAIQAAETVFDRENAQEADPPDSVANPYPSSEEEGVISTQSPSVDNNTISSMEQPKIFSDVREDYPESSSREGARIAFARKVLEEFEAAKGPLADATHFHLNAIARGRALVGDFQGCLDVLRIIIDRKEVPDIFDINVVVEALSKQDPSRAALLVDNMMKSNVMPDRVTFGTLISQALNNGDVALACRCFAQSRSLGVSGLTPATLVRLVQVSLGVANRRNISREVALRYVQGAYDVVASCRTPRNIFTLKVGQQGVEAALRVKSSRLASEFWDALVKGRIDKVSPEYVELRRLIAAQVRKDNERGSPKGTIGHK